MRASSIRKSGQQQIHHQAQRHSGSQDNESWDVRRARIAHQSNAASNLAGNDSAPDFEEFLKQYGKISDFA